MSPTLKYYVSLMGVVAGGLVSLARFDVPKGFWIDKIDLITTAVVVVALTAAFEVYDRDRARNEAKRKAWLTGAEDFLKTAFAEIVDATGAHFTEVGIHAFFVRRCWTRSPFPWPRLVQLHDVRFKLNAYPPPTHFTFEKGKGVVGLCWARKDIVRADLASLFRDHANDTKEQWETLSAEDRYGLNYDEFKRTGLDSGLVIAAPIRLRPKGRYIGCVSVDAPAKYFPKFDTPKIMSTLQVAANGIRNLTEF